MYFARLSAFILLLAAPAALAATGPLLPGRWEITMQTESPVESAPMTTEVCISEEKAKKPEVPKSNDKADCKVVSGGLSGNVLSYVTKCSKKNAGATSRFTFNGDRYEGVVEATVDGVTVRQVYSARRIGDCPEESGPRP